MSSKKSLKQSDGSSSSSWEEQEKQEVFVRRHPHAFRQSIDSIDQDDASPTRVMAANKRPWKRDGASATTTPRPLGRRGDDHQTRQRALPNDDHDDDVQQQQVNGSHIHGQKSTSSPVAAAASSVSIVNGSWQQQSAVTTTTMHPREDCALDDNHEQGRMQSIERNRETPSSSSDPGREASEDDATSASAERKQSMLSPANNDANDDNSPADATNESTSAPQSTCSPQQALRSKTSSSASSSSSGGPIHVAKRLEDEALAHLVRMVDSTDCASMENGDQQQHHVPLTFVDDRESRVSFSDYSAIVDDNDVSPAVPAVLYPQAAASAAAAGGPLAAPTMVTTTASSNSRGDGYPPSVIGDDLFALDGTSASTAGMYFPSTTMSSSGEEAFSSSPIDFHKARDGAHQQALLPASRRGGPRDDPSNMTVGLTSCSDAAAGTTDGEDAIEVVSRNFAMEHRIFMKAALELLTQRERYAADVDMNDKDTIKSGPLKKASHLVRGIWKVKYAEVRRGVFSYYEDESKDSEVGTLVRKNIPLHASTCTCRAVKIEHKALSVNPDGAIFELNVEGGPKRLWMANTREERSAWIQAIHTATLGRSVTRGDSDVDHYAGKAGSVSDESPYRLELELYVSIQRELSRASSREHYLGSLSELVGKKLNVPVQWIRQQMGGIEHSNRAFHEEAISRGVNQLWKDLLRDSVRVDDELFVGGAGHGPDRIIAALMRCIMGVDRSSPLSVNASEAQKSKYYISESQSLSYARDILLAGNRTRSGGDSYYCVNTLCRNPDQVVMVPSSLEAQPWQINIAHIQPEKRGRGDSYYSLNELSGWLRTRSKPQKKWKRRYFVLSEGTLSYFEKALPRPRGLRGQIGVAESAISVNRVSKSDSLKRSRSSSQDSDHDALDHFLVSILARDGKLDRQILFDDEKKFILWTHSLEAYCVNDEQWQSNHSVSKVRSMFRNLREELIGTQDLYGNFVLGHKSLKDNAEELGLDSKEVNACITNATKSGANGRATVMVSVEASTDYKICTLDPQGDEKEDTWATIRAEFLQGFRLSGGPNGRIVRGEEIVQINVTNCHRSGAVVPFEEHVSPRSRLRDKKRPLRIRRSVSS